MGTIITIIVLLLAIAVGFYGLYSRKSFRRMLPGELAIWSKEGLISEEQEKRLYEKYQLAKIAEESQSTLINAIFIFGAVLIACGIIAFIAAHWDGIPSFVKLTMIIGIMLAVYAIGFYLWKLKANMPRLGHALVLLGALIFGANIGLIAQIFHLSANFYDGFLVWTVGTLVIAYVTGSIPLADLALISSFIWFCGWKADNLSGLPVYPWLILLVFWPYAYRQRSRSLHFLTILGWGASLVISGISNDNSSVLWVIVAAGLTALIWWSYADWPWINRSSDFHLDGKFLGALALAGLSYFLSFHGIIQSITKLDWNFRLGWNMIQVFITIGLAIFSFSFGYLQSTSKNKMIAYSVAKSSAVLVFIAIGFGWFLGLTGGTILVNMAVVLWGAFLFWFGLNELDRRFFLVGVRTTGVNNRQSFL